MGQDKFCCRCCCVIQPRAKRFSCQVLASSWLFFPPRTTNLVLSFSRTKRKLESGADSHFVLFFDWCCAERTYTYTHHHQPTTTTTRDLHHCDLWRTGHAPLSLSLSLYSAANTPTHTLSLCGLGGCHRHCIASHVLVSPTFNSLLVISSRLVSSWHKAKERYDRQNQQ